jgi:hypothetical protein
MPTYKQIYSNNILLSPIPTPPNSSKSQIYTKSDGLLYYQYNNNEYSMVSTPQALSATSSSSLGASTNPLFTLVASSGGLSINVDTTKIDITETAIYNVSYNITLTGSITGTPIIESYISINGSGLYAPYKELILTDAGILAHQYTCVEQIPLTGGDYIQLTVLNASGDTINLSTRLQLNKN